MRKHNQDYAPPRQLVPDLSERVDWAIRRAMSADPERRPTSCREFLEDLTGQSEVAGRPSAGKGAPTGDRRPTTDDSLWYMVYKDEKDEVQTVKGTTDGIRRALKDRLLGDPSLIRVCHSKQGPFLGLRTYPEFRDLVVEPAPMAPAPGNSSVPRGAATPPATWSNRSSSAATPPSADALELSGTPMLPDRGPYSGRHPTPPSGRVPVGADTVALPAAGASGRLPHVPIGPRQPAQPPRPKFELVIWVGVLVIAVGTAIAAFRFFAP
jgi:hypothetical protein